VDTDTILQKALEPVILYRVDAEKGSGKDIAGEFKIRAYPTFILLNKNGQIIDLWLGYGGDFKSTLADARQDLSTIDEKKARYDAKPDLRSAIVLGRYSSAMGEYKEAVAYYTRAQALDKDSTQDYYYNIFENTAYGARKNLFTYDDAVKAGDAALASTSNKPWEAFAISNRMIGMAKSNDKPDDVAKYIKIGLDATANDKGLEKMHSELQVEYALSVRNDTAQAVRYKRDSMPKDWQDDVNGLNEFAWWCFENNTNLVEAEKLADKAVTMAKSGREKANVLDTAAEIKFTLGKTKDAIELEQQACKEAPDVSEFAQKVEDFQNKANSKK
jgi:tetratricopeptide (TPR) repeat protein